MSGKIFISYRRDDAPAEARQLHEKLSSAFGKKKVFMDIDNLLAGQRFDKELEKALSDCDVFLAVIGSRWLEILSDRTNKNEPDYVHMEVFSALKRDIIVIPVLVHGAKLPVKDQLPSNIQNLLLHQKQELTHERYNSNVDELIRAIKLVQQSGKSSSNSGGFMRWGKFLALFMGLGLGTVYIGPHVFEEVEEWQQARIKAELVDIEKQKKKVAVDVVPDKKTITEEKNETALKILGMTLSEITPSLREKYNISPKTKGVFIANIVKGSEAEQQGLQTGNVIVEIMQEVVHLPEDAIAKIEAARQTNEKHVILFLARGKGEFGFAALPLKSVIKQDSKKVVNLEKNLPRKDLGNQTIDHLDYIGLSLSPTRGKGEKGVLVTAVKAKSNADTKGIKIGDVIMEFNGMPVNIPAEVTEKIKEAKARNAKVILLKLKDKGYFGLILKTVRK